MSRPWLLLSVVVAALAGWLQPAGAGVLKVAPINLEAPPGRSAMVLNVSNPSTDSMSVQIRVFDWTQAGGVDVDTPTDAVGFSPPIFQLAPQSRQIVRLLLLGPRDPAREQAFRVYVDQIPSAAPKGVLQMPVRMVLPLFAAPQAAREADLQWSARREKDGRVRLTAFNPGTVHKRLRDLAAGSSEAVVRPVASGLAGYVLGGQSRSWSAQLGGGASPAEVVVKVLVDDHPARTVVPVSP